MGEDISQGYGSPEDMMAPQGDQLAGQEAPQEEGAPEGDMEAMIAEGVQAYMESQDPEIAHEVMMMLAEAMGLGGGMKQGAPAEQAAPAEMPMAKNGGKFGWFGDENLASDFQKFVSK